MRSDSIAIIPENGYNPEQKTSNKAQLWLKYISFSQKIFIEHSKNKGEIRLENYFGDGYHKDVYDKTTKGILDEKVAELCSKLQDVEDVKKYSLEMQMWWRDHQKADKARIKRIAQSKKEAKDKEELLSKLSPY